MRSCIGGRRYEREEGKPDSDRTPGAAASQSEGQGGDGLHADRHGREAGHYRRTEYREGGEALNR